MSLSIGTTADAAAADPVVEVRADGRVRVPLGPLDLGTVHRQEVQFADGAYGLGTQDGVLYQRSPAKFAWYTGGVHSDTALDPGTGTSGPGVRRLVLDAEGALDFGAAVSYTHLDVYKRQCPVCAGLHTFVRPRFFAGQLLTDTELTGLTTYMLDKQRLHNRYLHGYGVVCGLQVECDGCGPGVIVRPGYALDQCGNDLVLPDSITVPVDKLIAACTATGKVADCDPPRYPTASGCDDGEQTLSLIHI